jgi:hypothetical protein
MLHLSLHLSQASYDVMPSASPKVEGGEEVDMLLVYV